MFYLVYCNKKTYLKGKIASYLFMIDR